MGSLVYVLHAVLFKFCRYTLLFLSGQNSPPNPWVKNWWIRKQYSHTLIAQASFNRRVSCRIHMCRCHCHHYPYDYHQKWYCNWSPWKPREKILITFTMIQCLWPTIMRISLLIIPNQPDQSNPKHYAQRRWFFSKTSWKTPTSLPKCLVWPRSGWPVLIYGKRPQTKFQILFCKNHAEKQITPCESTVYYQRGFIWMVTP